MLRHRWLVVGAWLVVLLAGGYSNSKLSALLSNTFTMPGTDSERARTILKDHYGDRSDGSFTVVFRVHNSADPALRRRLQSALGLRHGPAPVRGLHGHGDARGGLRLRPLRDDGDVRDEPRPADRAGDRG